MKANKAPYITLLFLLMSVKMAVCDFFSFWGLVSHLKLLELLSHIQGAKQRNKLRNPSASNIDRLSSNHQADLTCYKMQFTIESSVKKMGGLLILVPGHWRVEILGKTFFLF